MTDLCKLNEDDEKQRKHQIKHIKNKLKIKKVKKKIVRLS